ncbi:MAG: hypothetical protein JO288_19555 [Hyphomicrobiales bacterium]|nr:hypothetical protein [Hyphomicrobiales bacterium]
MPIQLMLFLPEGQYLAVSFSLKDAANDNTIHPLDPKVLDVLGQAIKAYCDNLVHAPLPDKVLDLLSRLEASTAEQTWRA